MSESSSGQNWEFGKFSISPEMRVLLDDGVAVPLTSKAFDTLALLVKNRDRVVTKDELLRSVWPDVVVEEGNLTQQIFLLRKALGENAQQPRYIVTIPGHGYRFTANIKVAAGSTSSPAVTAPRFGAAHLAAGGAAVVAAVLGVAWLTNNSASPPPDLARGSVKKITESGKATESAMSRDGRHVAYVENDGDVYSLWAAQVGSGGRTQLVPRQPAILAGVTFSPDGEFVYFTRARKMSGKFVLSRVAIRGGVETPILDDVDTAVSFSPDGREFVFIRGTEETVQIIVAAAGGDAQRILAARPTFELVAPDWSPDGKTVAVTAADFRSSHWRWSIVTVPVAGGYSSELYSTASRIGRVRWLPDGSGVLTVISEALTRQFPRWLAWQWVHFLGGPIWRIDYPGGHSERLTSELAEHDLCCLDVATDGSAITGVINTLVSDLSIAAADNPSTPKQITWGKPILSRHGWLPDNDTIVYRDMGGALNAVHKDGRAFSLSLPAGQRVSGGVSVCGDGRYVVFQAAAGNGIWRTPANAGGAVMLTSGPVDENPACSHDGKWVMFARAGDRGASLWRVAIEGGEPTSLIAREGYDALPSPTGRYIYYSTSHWEEHPVRTRFARWIIASPSDARQLFSVTPPDDATAGVPTVWAPDDSGLDYVVTRAGVSNIWRQPVTGGAPIQLTRFVANKIFSFAWSRDGKWLSIASGSNRSDVVVFSGR